MPLGLATLAALCPSHWQVEIVDENVTSLPLDPQVDLIGVCGMGAQFDRQKEILHYYRGHGYPVVVGGSYASLCPEQYAGLADWVVTGEAEYIWPDFCRDFERGHPRALYRETGEVNLHIYGLLPGGPLRVYRFLRTLVSASPHAWAQVVTDWIVGLSMREYVQSHFVTDPRWEQRIAKQTADWLRKCYASSLRQGLMEITPRLKNGVTDLQLIIHGHVDQLFSARVMRRLERLLRRSGSTLTLHIEELGIEQHQQLKRLLRRLSPCGQRISIWTNEQLRTMLAIDSSDFHVMLTKP